MDHRLLIGNRLMNSKVTFSTRVRSRAFAVAGVATLAVFATALTVPASAAPIHQMPAPTTLVRTSVPPYPGILSVGSSGPAVTAVQKGLLAFGFAIPSLQHGGNYGYYGAETASAVYRFKRRHPALGTLNTMVGPNTYAALTANVSVSSAAPTRKPTVPSKPTRPTKPKPTAGATTIAGFRARAPYRWNTPAYAEWYAGQRIAAYGWRGAELTRCLHYMWIGESHWQYQEYTAPYLGIPQTTSGVANDYGYSWSTYASTPEVQVEVGLKYIRDRYGSPCKAWAFWKAQGAWQDSADPNQYWGGWY
jgi:peptidoglycan hydrolase-like protein with peptidoglycan-binding domain